jgi:hypothetical protein
MTRRQHALLSPYHPCLSSHTPRQHRNSIAAPTHPSPVALPFFLLLEVTTETQLQCQLQRAASLSKPQQYCLCDAGAKQCSLHMLHRHVFADNPSMPCPPDMFVLTRKESMAIFPGQNSHLHHNLS